ncbi:unnamed protein product [Periconia digitata]|uniref:Uncharacterized protein n=1 Tax=Periconia digitata TaxID=1303443 RepID=A0A9W4UMA3_9PLEO|nr:unnamed protein product [Periconia digitata]
MLYYDMLCCVVESPAGQANARGRMKPRRSQLPPTPPQHASKRPAGQQQDSQPASQPARLLARVAAAKALLLFHAGFHAKCCPVLRCTAKCYGPRGPVHRLTLLFAPTPGARGKSPNSVSYHLDHLHTHTLH